MNQTSRDFTVGALTFRVDGDTGMLRRVRFGGCEVLRGIYPSVRDERWGTARPAVTPMIVRGEPGALWIELEARVTDANVDLRWRAKIEAHATGTLSYRWRGEAMRTFKSNRTGLCVLHPAEAAGQPCRIEHTDGRIVAAWFPIRISPHQPFRDVRAIAHVPAAGTEVTVRMEGEVFETEDQRNWSDASFKTYCRPLDWPRPYEIARGQVIAQAITVKIAGFPPRRGPVTAEPLAQPAAAPLLLPRIGYELTGPLPPALRGRVRALRPAHVRVAARAGELDATLRWAGPEAAALGAELELAVRDAPSMVPSSRHVPADTMVLLYDADGNTVTDECVVAWRAAGFARVGTGTENHFTELNRQRPSAAGAHTLTTFGLNAQVHAFDDASLLETLTQHATLARHAAAIGAPRPIAVTPITLGPSADFADPRLQAGFGAVWTLASIAELTRGGAARATYFRAHGPGGFVRESAATPLEQLFAALAGAGRADVLDCDGWSDDPAVSVYALVVRTEPRHRLLVAHASESPLEIRVPFSGRAGFLGSAPTDFAAGPAQLAPRSVWQLEFSQ